MNRSEGRHALRLVWSQVHPRVLEHPILSACRFSSHLAQGWPNSINFREIGMERAQVRLR